MIVIAWEYADGSGGAFEADDDAAEDWARQVADERPSARVWCGETMIARGFIAADEQCEGTR